MIQAVFSKRHRPPTARPYAKFLEDHPLITVPHAFAAAMCADLHRSSRRYSSYHPPHSNHRLALIVVTIAHFIVNASTTPENCIHQLTLFVSLTNGQALQGSWQNGQEYVWCHLHHPPPFCFFSWRHDSCRSSKCDFRVNAVNCFCARLHSLYSALRCNTLLSKPNMCQSIDANRRV